MAQGTAFTLFDTLYRDAENLARTYKGDGVWDEHQFERIALEPGTKKAKLEKDRLGIEKDGLYLELDCSPTGKEKYPYSVVAVGVQAEVMSGEANFVAKEVWGNSAYLESGEVKGTRRFFWQPKLKYEEKRSPGGEIEGKYAVFYTAPGPVHVGKGFSMDEARLLAKKLYNTANVANQ